MQYLKKEEGKGYPGKCRGKAIEGPGLRDSSSSSSFSEIRSGMRSSSTTKHANHGQSQSTELLDGSLLSSSELELTSDDTSKEELSQYLTKFLIEECAKCSERLLEAV